MTVLVTGGAGFIGSNLVDELMVQGYDVRVLDDLSEGRRDNFKQWEGNKRFQFIKGSILDFDLVKRCCDHVSCVFHLAADSRIQTGIADPRHSIETNVIGTSNVAEAARQMDVKRIVYSASSSAYGRKNDHYLIRSKDTVVIGLNEDMRTDCLNPYSMSKKAGEDIMDVYNRLYGLSTVSLRYFNVYGPRHQEDGRYATVIAIFRRQLRYGKPMTVVGDGKQRRDFTFVGDVVRANMFAAMNHDAVGVFNIGSGKNYSIIELANLVAGGLYDEDWIDKIEYIPQRLGEAQITLADCKKANDMLGWKAEIQLEQGLQLLDEFERKFPRSNIIAI